MFESIRTITKDKLHLDGIYSEGSKDKPAVLFIHGMFNNFQTPNFVKPLGNKLHEKGFAFLATNNRGAEEGSKYELLEEAHLDITAGVKFLLDKGYEKIILVGHSAGTVKAVRYLFEGEYKNKVVKLVLIVPVDSLGGRIANGRKDIEKFLAIAEEKVVEGKGKDLITSEFDHDTLSYQTFISWYKRDDFGKMFEFCDKNYDFPLLKKINLPTKIIVGTKDKYFYPTNPEHAEEAMKILLENTSNLEGKIIQNADHAFNGFEEELVGEIVKFATR